MKYWFYRVWLVLLTVYMERALGILHSLLLSSILWLTWFSTCWQFNTSGEHVGPSVLAIVCYIWLQGRMPSSPDPHFLLECDEKHMYCILHFPQCLIIIYIHNMVNTNITWFVFGSEQGWPNLIVTMCTPLYRHNTCKPILQCSKWFQSLLQTPGMSDPL